jgi:cysteinyl-tRNA synthetase
MLTVGGAKMAKSEGNFITVRQALAQAPGEVIRLALLGTHYRAPLDWTEDRLHEAKVTLHRLYFALLQAPRVDWQGKFPVPDEITDALADDLNTPSAVRLLGAIANEMLHSDDDTVRAIRRPQLVGGGQLLGLLTYEHDPIRWFQGDAAAGDIEDRIAARAAARNERRFEDADRIRDELAEEGILLEDGPNGTTWRRG